MVNKRFWLGMLVMLLTFGMTVVGCDNGTTNENGFSGDTALNGIWVNETISEMRFNNGNGETFQKPSGNPFSKWTYITNNGEYTYRITHLHGRTYGLESRWYSREELQNLSITVSLDGTQQYSISGNILTITTGGIQTQWNKK